MTGSNRRRKNAFKEQNGLCFWCKLPMVLLENFSDFRQKKNPPPANVCTLDHLYEYNDPMRKEGRLSNGTLYKNVAACITCNNDRSAPRRKSTSYMGA